MSMCQSQPLVEKMEPKEEILEGWLMVDVKYLLDYNIMEQSELERVMDRRNLFLKKRKNNDVNREDFMAQIREELKLVDVFKFNIDNRLQTEEMQYDYCKAMNLLVNTISYTYSRMLQIHPTNLSSLEDYIDFRYTNKSFIIDKPNLLHQVIAAKHDDLKVYKVAATLQYFKMNDVASARICLSEGLKFHKNSKKLLFDEFDLELQNLHDTNGESLPFALSKYEYLVKCFKGDLEFHFTLLDAVLRLDSVCELHYRVVSDMFVEYKQHEKMWQKLAVVTSKGYIFDFELKRMHYNRHCNQRLPSSIKVFVDSLNEDWWSPEKRKILWNMFIDHMITIWRISTMENETIPCINYVNVTMEQVFEGALHEGCLYKAEHYLYWALHDNKFRFAITLKALNMNINNVCSWLDILVVYIEARSSEMVKKVFEYAVAFLRSNSTPLWRLVEEYIIKHGVALELFEFYQKAIFGPYPIISMMFRPNLLKLFALSYGISITRKLFNELNKLSPPCKQLYVDMIAYEQTSSNFNKKQISKLYREVCFSLRQGDVALWANYIKFEYTHVDQYTAKNIYNSSLEYLGPDLFSTLTIEFKNMKREYYERNTRIINPDIIDVDEA